MRLKIGTLIIFETTEKLKDKRLDLGASFIWEIHCSDISKQLIE